MIDWVLTARLAGAIATGLGLILIVNAIATTMGMRRMRCALTAEVDRAESGFRALTAEVSQLATANLALREYLVVLSERVEQSRHIEAVQAAPATGRAYELAARLAAGGSSSNDLVANCGLTRAEAELAVLVHGNRARASH
jgi:hypothetical protein